MYKEVYQRSAHIETNIDSHHQLLVDKEQWEQQKHNQKSLSFVSFYPLGIFKWIKGNIRNHEKIGLAIPWNEYFMDNPELRDHLENMHSSPLFQMGWLKYLDVKKVVSDFKDDPINNYTFIRQLFFNSYWYKTIFSEWFYLKS